MKIITPTPVLLSFALAVTLGVAGASGQDNSENKKPQQPSSSSPTASKSRERRVVANSSDEPTPSAAEQPKTPKAGPSNDTSVKPRDAATKAGEEPTETTGTKGTDKPVDKSSEKPGDAKPLQVPAPNTLNANSDAVTSLREQIDAAPNGSDRIRLQLKLAEQLAAADKKPEAITELHAIINADVFDPQGFYNAGNALARLGESEGAINAYRKAIDQRKGNYSRALNNLGVVLLREGRWDEAYDALLSALKLESFHYAEASYNLGRLYSARGETDLAIREWRRALTIDPEHNAAAQALSRAGSEGGVVVRAEAPAKGPTPTKNIRSLPENSAKDTVVAGGSKNSSAPRSSTTATVLAVDAVSYDFLQRARNFSEHGKLQEAVENYQRVISRSRGYFPPANLELSYVQMKLKRNDEALANLTQVANRDGARFPISYYFLARLYELKGDLISAEESFARVATAYKTTNRSFLLDLSRVRERRGDFKGALAAMEEYVAAMEQQGQKPSWSDESLSVLRRKATGTQVQPK